MDEIDVVKTAERNCVTIDKQLAEMLGSVDRSLLFNAVGGIAKDSETGWAHSSAVEDALDFMSDTEIVGHVIYLLQDGLVEIELDKNTDSDYRIRITPES